MAGRDYLKCKKCFTKIVYDGNDTCRDRLEAVWGDPDADSWTVGLLCPDCIKRYEEVLNKAMECLGAGRYSTAKKVIGSVI
jgi:hypothetical protein